MRRVPHDPEARRDLARVTVAYHAAELARAEVELAYLEAAFVPVALPELPADVLGLIAATDREVFATLRRTCRRLAGLLLYNRVYVDRRNLGAVMTAPRTYLRPEWGLTICWRSLRSYTNLQISDWLRAAAPRSLRLINTEHINPPECDVPNVPTAIPASIARLFVAQHVVTNNLYRIIDRDAVRRLAVHSPAHLLHKGKQAFANLIYLRLASDDIWCANGRPKMTFRYVLKVDLVSAWNLLYVFNVCNTVLHITSVPRSRIGLRRHLGLRYQNVWAIVEPEVVPQFLEMFTRPPGLEGDKYKLFE